MNVLGLISQLIGIENLRLTIIMTETSLRRIYLIEGLIWKKGIGI